VNRQEILIIMHFEILQKYENLIKMCNDKMLHKVRFFQRFRQSLRLAEGCDIEILYSCLSLIYRSHRKYGVMYQRRKY